MFLYAIGAAGLITVWWLIASWGPVWLDWVALTFLDVLGFKASVDIGFFLVLAVLTLFAPVSEGEYSVRPGCWSAVSSDF